MLNQCSFIGNLGHSPKSSYLPDGAPVAKFDICVSRKVKDKEYSEWVKVVAFGKLAELCSMYLSAGSKVFVQGRMQTRKYKDNEGLEKSSTEIVMEAVEFLGAKEPVGAARKADEPYGTTRVPESLRSDDNALDDDIPF